MFYGVYRMIFTQVRASLRNAYQELTTHPKSAIAKTFAKLADCRNEPDIFQRAALAAIAILKLVGSSYLPANTLISALSSINLQDPLNLLKFPKNLFYSPNWKETIDLTQQQDIIFNFLWLQKLS